MKTILITGSSGFIGSALVNKLENSGNKIIEHNEFISDISNSNCFNYISKEKIDHIFHLAGKTYIPLSWECPHDFYKVNVLGTENVLDLCFRKKATLTYVSAYLYGNPSELPISETCPLSPNNPYAHSKFIAEQLCKFYYDYYNVSVNIIRPFNVYGPNQNKQFLIPVLIDQAINNNIIRVKDLAPKRDYVYIDDLVNALIACMNVNPCFSIFNIGSGISYSVSQIIDFIQNILSISKSIESENIIRNNEIFDTVADISNAKRILFWKPEVTIIEGLKIIIKEFKLLKM